MHTKVFRICCFLLLLACALLQLNFSVQEQRTFTDRKGRLPKDQIRNARLLTYHAKQKHMFDADMDGALSLLQRALIINPYYVPAWLSLAELKNDTGEKEQAYEILHYTDILTRGLKRWRWDKALVAYLQQVFARCQHPSSLGNKSDQSFCPAIPRVFFYKP